MAELFAEVRSQQSVFDAHTDLCADREHHNGGDQQWNWSEQEASAQQDTKHGGVDGVPEPAVRSGAHQLVIGA